MLTAKNLEITGILNSVAERGATDVHFIVGSPVFFRINERLVNSDDNLIINQEFINGLVDFFVPENKKKLLEDQAEMKFVFAWEEKARFRVHIFRQKGYLAVSLKLIPPFIKSIEELGLPKAVQNFAMAKKGLILVSGPYNSGRTATMAAFIETINKYRSERIVTLEEPIEQLYANQMSIVEQREVGSDVFSFASALTSLKDEDADVVCLSKVDSVETMELMLELSVGGKLVMAVMNYDSAIGTLSGIISDFPESKKSWVRSVLSENLVCLIVQRLVPGINGLVLAAEILTSTPSSKTLIAEGHFSQLENIIQTSRGEGMISLDYSLANLVKVGRISQDVALRFAMNQKTFNILLAK